ncbi:MAG TPA: NAD+ synthase [Candidatus Nanoarchaeia archaeon]|nr:NAD+ synthase [Candidatus Nanoarchaeia archaeon]
MDCQKVRELIVAGIKDYFTTHNFKKAVIGLSGGIDSTVCAYLAVEAVGSGNVTGIFIPDHITSSQSHDDAHEVAKRLNIKTHTIEIHDIVDFFKKLDVQFNSKSEIPLANSKARARMMILYYYANVENTLVIGTSDKSETMLGYATKFGDSAADIEPIGELWKTEVIEFGKFLKVPESITSKKPSPELMQGKTADTELGAAYEVLDEILKLHFERKLNANEIIKEGFDKKLVENIFERIRLNEHKRKMPPVLKIG